MKPRGAPWPGLAAIGLLLALLPVAARSGEPQQDKPADKPPARPVAKADKPGTKKDVPARPTPSALRFTDEDLEKYRKPTVAETGETLDEQTPIDEVVPGPAPQAAAPTDAPKPPLPKPSPPKPHPQLVRTPPKAAKPPAEDPLKPWKDREALETYRTEQVGDLRSRIAALQSRLDHLVQKRLAILDPLRVMPQPQSAGEGAQDAERSPRDLLETVEAETESVKAELDQAKQDLIAVETRFTQETAAR